MMKVVKVQVRLAALFSIVLSLMVWMGVPILVTRASGEPGAGGVRIKQRNPVVNEGNRIGLAAADGQGQPLREVTWSSGSPDIARVDPRSGEVEGLRRGFATVTATAADGQTASVFVTVVRVEKGKGEKVPGATEVDALGQLYLSSPLQSVIMKAANPLAGAFELYAGHKNVAGSQDGLRNQALFAGPTAVGIDNRPSGGVYVADTLNHAIRKIGFSNQVETVGGTGAPGVTGFDLHGTAPLTELRLRSPRGIAVERGGNLYVADTDNHAVLYVDLAARRVSLVAGKPGTKGQQDGSGQEARFFRPAGLALTEDGRTLAVADEGNSLVRLIQLERSEEGMFNAQVRSLGATIGSPAQAVQEHSGIVFQQPDKVSLDVLGNLYVVAQEGVFLVTRALGAEPEVVEVAQPGVTFKKPVAVTPTPQGVVILDAEAGNAGEALQLVSVEGPTIESLSQREARIDGGQQVTVRGTNFAPDTIVILGDEVVKDLKVTSATELSFTVPPQMLPGERTLTVQTRGGLAQERFTIVPKKMTELLPGEATILAGGLAFNGDGKKADDPEVILGFCRLALDANGNVYLGEGTGIRKIQAQSKIINTIAGGGVIASEVEGQPGLATSLLSAYLIALDRTGNLFFAEGFFEKGRLRKIDSLTGAVTTVLDEKQLPALRFGGITGLVIGLDNSLYFAVNHQLYWLNPTSKEVKLLAGTGEMGFAGDNGPALQAKFSFERFGYNTLAVDSSDNLLVVDTGNFRIRRIDAKTGSVTTVAGNGKFLVGSLSGEGGAATEAAIIPMTLAVDTADNIIINDQIAYVRKIDAKTGMITTIAGNGKFMETGDGGPARQAGVGTISIGFDGMGNMYLGTNSGIRRVDALTGIITTYAGQLGRTVPELDGAKAYNRLIPGVQKVLSDGKGNQFLVADSRVLRLDGQTQTIKAYAGSAERGFRGDGGPAKAALISRIVDAALDSKGNLYIAEAGDEVVPNSPRVRRVDQQTGIISTVVGGKPVQNQRVEGASGTGTEAEGDGGPALGVSINVGSIAIDAKDNLYISEPGRIRLVNTQTGILTTFAGNGTPGFLGDGGKAAEAQLGTTRLLFDGGENLFLGDVDNHVVRRIDAVTSIITRVAGNRNPNPSPTGGPATAIGIGKVTGMALDGGGNLFLSSTQIGNVYRVDAKSNLCVPFLQGETIKSFLSKIDFYDISAHADINLDREGNGYYLRNGFVIGIKSLAEPGTPGIGPRTNGTGLPAEVKVSGATYQNKVLTLTGTGFSGSGLNVTLNGREITRLMVGQSETKLTFQGSAKKLAIQPGTNAVTVTVNGKSATAMVTIP